MLLAGWHRLAKLIERIAGFELPRLDGRRTVSPIRRADGVSSPNLAFLLVSK